MKLAIAYWFLGITYNFKPKPSTAPQSSQKKAHVSEKEGKIKNLPVCPICVSKGHIFLY